MTPSHCASQAQVNVWRSVGDVASFHPSSVVGKQDRRAVNGCTACEVRETSFCGALQKDELGALARIHKRSELQADASLFYEGDPADSIATVTSGLVRLVKLLADGRRQVLRFVAPGEYFGFNISETFGYSAESVIPSIVCQFPISGLERICGIYPDLQWRLFVLARQELDRQQEHIVLLGRNSIPERLAAFLLHWASIENGADASRRPLMLPMRRADVADYLGTTVETVARTLTHFRRQQLISLPSCNMVVFRDFDRLCALAQGENGTC